MKRDNRGRGKRSDGAHRKGGALSSELHDFLVRQMKGRGVPIELLDNLADSLGSSSGSRDDVVDTRATCTPVLARGTIYGLLCGGDGVNSGHQTLNDAILLVDNLYFA
jgi:hypothetical protein